MVLVFFVVNLLRIDLYDVVKEIKKGRDTMKTIIKRSILDYLKNPVLWIGLIIIVASMYPVSYTHLDVYKRQVFIQYWIKMIHPIMNYFFLHLIMK